LDDVEFRKKQTKLYNDVDFIQEIRDKGYKTGIVTGAPPHIASLEIGMLGGENFDAVVIASSRMGIIPKPHPHGIEECLSMLEISNNEAMYVGNAEEDVISAKNANVYDVLLLRGEHEFPDIDPSLTIHSLYELREIL
jgi:phosphoglycolate phosphatase-like HAD superfamily hydrolase